MTVRRPALFATAYPEAVDLAGPDYVPGEPSDAIAHWMIQDAPRPPITPPRADLAASSRLAAFAIGKANQARHDRSRYWFSRHHDGGNVILHHRHIRPALIRPWSPVLERIEGAIWASESLDAPPSPQLAECAR